MAASNRATSTCGLLRSPGRRPGCCPGGLPASPCARVRWSSIHRREAGRKTRGCLDNPLLSRYAECIFWLARSVERAENLARILEVNETFSRDRSGGHNWLSIVQLNTDERAFFDKHSTVSAENVIRFYLTDADNPTSIVSAVTNARDNARSLRPLVSTEMWVQLNVTYNRVIAIDPGEL